MKTMAFACMGMQALMMTLVSVSGANSGSGFGSLDTAGSSMVLAYHGKPIFFVSPQREKEPCWYVTESGYIAAVEEELLDRAIFWAGLGDEQEFEKFITSNPLVFPLRAGLRVQIDKFSFSDKVRIRPHGTSISVWTVREAIRSAVPMDGS